MNVDVEASEKLYADFELTATNPGGHSSLPIPDNAIYHLADALSRLEHSRFRLNSTRDADLFRTARAAGSGADHGRYERHSADSAGCGSGRALSKDPRYNSLLRTTCVATRLNAGHANNALPQNAQAIVNCRILPGHSPEEIAQALMRIFADPKVAVQYVDNAGQVFDRAPETKGFRRSCRRPKCCSRWSRWRTRCGRARR